MPGRHANVDNEKKHASALGTFTRPEDLGRRRVLYVDPWAGASGDMLLAALIHSDPDAPKLEQALAVAVETLGIPGLAVKVSPDTEGGLSCLRVQVHEEHPSARLPEELLAVVEGASLPKRVKERSVRTLRRLVDVEAGIHGVDTDQVHLHELGSADTLVDVVGTFTLVDILGIDEVVTARVPLGSGYVATDHGELPVPAPATLELLRGCPVMSGGDAGEMTTPTGALLLTELTDVWGPLPRMEVAGIGYGAGSRSRSGGANVLRVVVGECGVPGGGSFEVTGGCEDIVLLETLVDDATPEIVADARAGLMRVGAVDSWLRQVIGKKGRPALELCALVKPSQEKDVVGAIIRGCGTLGVRRQLLERHVVARQVREVDVGGHRVRVKIGCWRGEMTACTPEYEDAAAVAQKLGRTLSSVMHEAEEIARGQML